MNWILFSPPPVSSDPDNPPKIWNVHLSYDKSDIVQTVINGDPDRNGFTFDIELHLPVSYR